MRTWNRGRTRPRHCSYVILGLLVVTMCVLGYFLYEKKQREGGGDTANKGKTDDDDTGHSLNPKVVPGTIPPGPVPGRVGLGNALNPGKGPNFPGPGKGPNPGNGPKKNLPPTENGGGIGLPFLGGASGGPITAAEANALITKFKTQIVGTWKADLGDGKMAEIVYRADGTFTDTLTKDGTPTTVTGKWTAGTLVAGNKGLQVNRMGDGGNSQLKVIFDDGEMLHDTQEKGTLGVFKKQ